MRVRVSSFQTLTAAPFVVPMRLCVCVCCWRRAGAIFACVTCILLLLRGCSGCVFVQLVCSVSAIAEDELG